MSGIKQGIGKQGRLRAYVCAMAAMVVIFAAMCLITGESPSVYKYPTYLLQAQAWLRGEVSLPNYEYLELAVYDGGYYVSFPPVPSVPMVLYTLLFGDQVPGGLFQKIYIMIAAALILSELMRVRRMPPRDAAAWAVLFTLGSAMLPISLVGAVWYEAQIMAFLFCVSAIIAARRRHMTAACVCYALAVGCRPFSCLIGPVLLADYLRSEGDIQTKLRRLIPGILCGLMIAAGYGVYNAVRFGNPLEFGHNYLPEFTRSEHGQLSIAYLWGNLKQFLFGSPVTFDGGSCAYAVFGFSMFLSCPMLIIGAVWTIGDIARRRMDVVKWLALAMQAANVLLLCMHRTLGGYQFGARYALELMPLCLARVFDRKRLALWECALLAAGLILNFIGGCYVHV